MMMIVLKLYLKEIIDSMGKKKKIMARIRHGVNFWKFF